MKNRAEITEDEISLVRQYTGWAQEMAKAAIAQWKERNPAWTAEYIREYLVVPQHDLTRGPR